MMSEAGAPFGLSWVLVTHRSIVVLWQMIVFKCQKLHFFLLSDKKKCSHTTAHPLTALTQETTSLYWKTQSSKDLHICRGIMKPPCILNVRVLIGALLLLISPVTWPIARSRLCPEMTWLVIILLKQDNNKVFWTLYMNILGWLVGERNDWNCNCAQKQKRICCPQINQNLQPEIENGLLQQIFFSFSSTAVRLSSSSLWFSPRQEIWISHRTFSGKLRQSYVKGWCGFLQPTTIT